MVKDCRPKLIPKARVSQKLYPLEMRVTNSMLSDAKCETEETAGRTVRFYYIWELPHRSIDTINKL